MHDNEGSTLHTTRNQTLSLELRTYPRNTRIIHSEVHRDDFRRCIDSFSLDEFSLFIRNQTENSFVSRKKSKEWEGWVRDGNPLRPRGGKRVFIATSKEDTHEIETPVLSVMAALSAPRLTPMFYRHA